MMWPDTKLAVQNNPQQFSIDKRVDDFFSWLMAFPGVVQECAQNAFESGFHQDAETLLTFITDQAKGKISDEENDVFLTLVCASVLSVSPNIETWKVIRKIISNSWAAENWISQAMLALCKTKITIAETYATLIKDIFYAVESNTLRSQFENRENERNNFVEYWSQQQNKLEEIWWQLRRFDSLLLEESRLFPVLAKMDPDGFVDLLSSSRDPFVIQSALAVSGAGHFSPRLEFWELLMHRAPVAFSETGTWNGELLLPLLLSHIYARLTNIPDRLFHEFDLSEEAFKEELNPLTAHIGKIIGAREDAAGIVTRWGAWLMRNFMLGEAEINNLKRPAYLYGMMVDALGQGTANISLPDTSPPESPAWESMCYFAVRASFVYEKCHTAPPLDEFKNLWCAAKSTDYFPALIRAKTKLSLHFHREGLPVPGLISRAFAFMFITLGETSENWLTMWQSSYFMREIAEFGSHDRKSDEYSDRHDAGSLMLILCSTGIAAFDNLAYEGCNGNQVALSDAISLFKHLASAMMEMMAVDDTINAPLWKNLYLHLCLRRLIWDKLIINRPERDLFSPCTRPSLGDILDYYKAEPMDLCLLLSSCLSNGIPSAMLKGVVATEGIDLQVVLDKLHYMNSLSESKFPLNKRLVQDIEGLM
ncbi:hypothetical protein D3C79_367880 [compost metagenome]